MFYKLNRSVEFKLFYFSNSMDLPEKGASKGNRLRGRGGGGLTGNRFKDGKRAVWESNRKGIWGGWGMYKFQFS